MEKAFWEDLSDNYEAEVFSVCHNDKNKTISKHLGKYVKKKSIIADYGCGIGHFIPMLQKRAQKLYAYDISQQNIKRSRSRFSDFDHVQFKVCDLSKVRSLPKVDYAFSVNMLIMPSLTVQNKILDKTCRSIKKGGYYILVVPSLESSLYSNVRLREWNLDLGLSPRSAVRSGFPKNTVNAERIRCEGVLSRTGAATKFYLKEELQVLLEKRSMDIKAIEKVEYDWHSEFDMAPSWMKEPYPWDWLVVARKK